MINPTGLPDRTRLKHAYEIGELIPEVFRRFGLADRADILATMELCIEMHNAGEINLISLAGDRTLLSVSDEQHFAGQRLLVDAIPKLRASVPDMMLFVQALVEKGGTGYLTQSAQAAFGSWCANDLSRLKEVASLARDNNALAQQFLSVALIAGNMVTQGTSFAESNNQENKRSGVVALGRMEYKDSLLADSTIRTLLHEAKKTDSDDLLSKILLSTAQISANVEQANGRNICAIIEYACKAHGRKTMLSCARVLWLFHRHLCNDAIDLLLQALHSVDSSDREIISELDNALAELLDTKHDQSAINLVRDLLIADRTPVTIFDFDGFRRKLTEGSSKRIQQTFVFWMLTGKRPLCEAAGAFFRRTRDKEIPLAFSLQDIPVSSEEQIFLSKKTIGYLFSQPVAASSILVAILRVRNPKASMRVGNLLLNPLLLSYGGAVKDYLSSISKEDQAYAQVRRVLKHGSKYIKDLNSVGIIKELRPSERQRQIHRDLFHDQMRQAQKDAEKESVLLSLVRRSTILYGKKSLTYIEGPGNERRPIEMHLQEHGFEFEMPRLDLIDPVGLDYLLRLFRAETFKV